MSDGGKGSAPRPFSVSNEEYANRWDAIFGKDLNNEQDDVSKILPEGTQKAPEVYTETSDGSNSQ